MNENNQGFGQDNRYELRKRKRMNRILNGSILVVGALILFFAVQLFLPASEEASEDENQQNTPETEEEAEHPDDAEQTTPDNNQETDNQSESVDTDNPSEDNSDETTEEQDEQNNTDSSNSEKENEDDQLSVPEAEDGEWEPIGTEQTGSFSHDFDSDSQNWKEMEAALRYATGLSKDEMTVWRIENGGGVDRVVGTVSTENNASQPLQVTMQFVENEGWKPLEVERLDSNPYK